MVEASPSLVPSTVKDKWMFNGSSSTPEDGVRKKLFDFEAEEDDNAMNQWSSSSEYFSQSGLDSSCMSGRNQSSNLFAENSPQQQPKSEVSNYSRYLPT